MAIGSRRTTPTAPVAAAVVSEAIVAPTNTPCSQSNDWYTSGTVRARRPPNRIALIGTPCGSSQCGEITGFWVAGVVNRELGWAALVPEAGVQGLPCQSVRCWGTGPSMPSHHTPPSSVIATLVKIEFLPSASMALGLVLRLVPGATPKTPAS